MPPEMDRHEAILQFWLGDLQDDPLQNQKKWWQKDEAFDRDVAQKFRDDLARAIQGQYESWKETAEGALAYIILLDQFSRNIFRNTPQAFAQDERALQASLELQNQGGDRTLSPVERWFLYMPMMHAEDLSVQRQSVAAFRSLADDAPSALKEAMENAHKFAVQHCEIIERFGRFPHRNAILGRKSTPEEIEFLKQPGSSF